MYLSRPAKLRYVSQLPRAAFFRPIGTPLYELQEVHLTVEEVETIRLKDLKGLEQEECARRMHISRPTFHRVVASARCKLADALINGKAIQIEGGNFGLSQQRFRCTNDGHEWNVPFEMLALGAMPACPICSGINVQPLTVFGFRGRHWRGARGRPGEEHRGNRRR